MKTKLLLDLATSLLLISSSKITMILMENEASPSSFYEILFITKIICFILAVFYLNHGITTFLFSEDKQRSVGDSVPDPPFAHDLFIKKSGRIDVWRNEKTGMNFPFSFFFPKKYSIQSLKSPHNRTFIYEKACSPFTLSFLSCSTVVLAFLTVDK